jgi:hypothetical protein
LLIRSHSSPRSFRERFEGSMDRAGLFEFVY